MRRKVCRMCVCVDWIYDSVCCTVAVSCDHGNKSSGSIKGEFYWQAKRLSTSQEWLCTVYLAIYLPFEHNTITLSARLHLWTESISKFNFIFGSDNILENVPGYFLSHCTFYATFLTLSLCNVTYSFLLLFFFASSFISASSYFVPYSSLYSVSSIVKKLH
jgi:hypothetical protein